MAAPAVPFDQVLKAGDHADEAVPVKRALQRAGYDLPGPMLNYTAEWGPHAVDACAKFQKAKKVPLKGAKPGTYTYATHEALRHTHRRGSTVEWAFDAYSIQLMEGLALDPDEKLWAILIDHADACARQWPVIDYAMDRPWPDVPPPPIQGRWRTDCSGITKQLRHWIGRDIDDGLPRGYGNTASLWAHGQHVARLADATVGDLVLYGRPWLAGAAAHVVTLTERIDGRWRAISHGHRDSLGPSPQYVWADYRAVVGIRRYPL